MSRTKVYIPEIKMVLCRLYLPKLGYMGCHVSLGSGRSSDFCMEFGFHEFWVWGARHLGSAV